MITASEVTERLPWLGERRKFLGASDLGAVDGKDPYRSPLSVYMDKLGIETGVEETRLMRRGRMFEAAAVEYLREDHPAWTIERPRLFYRDDEAGLCCTPDCFARDDEGRLVNIQIKTISAPQFEKWNDRPPLGYLLQTSCENMLVDADRGILAVLVTSTYDAELKEFPVRRHPQVEERIREIARDFWANVRAGVAPQPDYNRDAELIAALHPPDPDVPVPLDLTADNRIGQVLEERDSLKALIREAEGQVKAFDAEIIDKLAGAGVAAASGCKISYTLTHRGEYVVPAKSFPSLRVSRTKEAAA